MFSQVLNPTSTCCLKKIVVASETSSVGASLCTLCYKRQLYTLSGPTPKKLHNRATLLLKSKTLDSRTTLQCSLGPRYEKNEMALMGYHIPTKFHEDNKSNHILERQPECGGS